jgi:anti-sigma B factor antagonist
VPFAFNTVLDIAPWLSLLSVNWTSGAGRSAAKQPQIISKCYGNKDQWANLRPKPVIVPGIIFIGEEINMALKITNREVGGVAVLALDGRIVLGEETISLREKVKSLLGDGKKSIVLNMSNVTLIDSSGLGALVSAHSSAKSAGASLRLCNLGSKFNELLQITKLYTVFEFSESEADALGALAKKASAV